MKVIESNKLIAEFMRLNLGDQMYTLDKLHYHVSWDWLKRVTKKIGKIVREDEVAMHYIETEFQYDHMMYVANDVMTSPDIKGVHECVVRFIKWYNKKEKQL